MILLRNATPLFRPELWAEDGTVMFREALEDGLRSFIIPMCGYLEILQRAVAYGATFLPVRYSPALYAATSLIVNIFSICYFLREGFAWIIPKYWQRWLCVFFLSIGPGTAEVFFNHANSQSSLIVLGFLLLLEKPHEIGRVKFWGLNLIFLSAGGAIIYLPLLMWFYFSTRSKSYGLLVASLLLIAVINTSLHMGTENADNSHIFSSLFLAPIIVFENFLFRLFPLPVLGPEYILKFNHSVPVVFWGLGAFLLGAGYLLFRKLGMERWETNTLFFTFLCACSHLAIVAVVRPGSLVRRMDPSVHWEGRYAYFTGTLALILWGALLSRLWLSKNRRMQILAGVFLLAITVPLYENWGRVPRRPRTNWHVKSQEIQAVLDLKKQGLLTEPKIIREIQIHPEGAIRFDLKITP